MLVYSLKIKTILKLNPEDKMSNLTKTGQSIKFIIKHLRAKFGHQAPRLFLPSLHHALDGYLIGHIPANVFEIRPPMKGLISLTIAQISKSSSYYLFVNNSEEKTTLNENFVKTGLKTNIRTIHPHKMLRDNKLTTPDLVIINGVTNKTFNDDISLLDELLNKIKEHYQTIGVFIVLSPELSATNWYTMVSFMENNSKPFTYITEKVLAGKLNIIKRKQ
ncbi:MAG: hypothetical protein HY973_02685 [Candidatus Kerfeldbacteria bacterium]|nr:hypothetical protein [Candidatus Kerfeldbacteria bacterium]